MRGEDKKVVVLVGFSGVGKSAVGKALSVVKKCNYVDVDSEIERRHQQTIDEIFRVEGEKKFRNYEQSVIHELLESGAGVLSLGGGALMTPEVAHKAFEKGQVVWLCASAETIAERVLSDQQAASGRTVRPVLSSVTEGSAKLIEQVEKLLDARKASYDKAGLRIWTDFAPSEEVARHLLFELSMDEHQGHLACLPYVLGSVSSESSGNVVVGSGLIRSLSRRIAYVVGSAEKIALIVDERVFELWGEKLQACLSEQALEVIEFVVPSGERSKSLHVVGDLTEQMLSSGFSRQDVVVAIGGGVVGDLAGLVASVYMRGVPLVQVPTTVVAQVDSAIGGKTGVNLEGGKNSLGTFYQARLVLSDVDFLSTLPDREYNEGLAEVVKYGLIASEKFFCWLEKNTSRIKNRDVECLTEMVEFCARTKLDFVSRDVEDRSGVRAKLNFGHTVGHALEKLSGYGALLHGEAVSIGMIQALRFGLQLGVTEHDVLTRTELLLKSFLLPTEIPRELCAWGESDRAINAELQVKGSRTVLDLPELWSKALSADKKRISSRIRFVFVSVVGKSQVQEVELSDLLRFVTVKR